MNLDEIATAQAMLAKFDTPAQTNLVVTAWEAAWRLGIKPSEVDAEGKGPMIRGTQVFVPEWAKEVK